MGDIHSVFGGMRRAISTPRTRATVRPTAAAVEGINGGPAAGDTTVPGAHRENARAGSVVKIASPGWRSAVLDREHARRMGKSDFATENVFPSM